LTRQKTEQLTVIIPTYNEADNLPNLVSALFALPLENLRILVVDDNSADGTGKLAEELALEHSGKIEVIHRAGKLGLGSAYRLGFRKVLQTETDAIAQMDADFSHPPELLIPLLDSLQDSDVAFGSRYIPGGGVDDHWPFWRKGLSAFGNFYARTILGLPLKDVTGGYRVWRRQTLLGMPLEFIRSNGYSFLVEMAYVSYRLGYTFSEVPFYFADRRWGDSKMSFKIQLEASLRIWQIRYVYRNLTPRRNL